MDFKYFGFTDVPKSAIEESINNAIDKSCNRSQQQDDYFALALQLHLKMQDKMTDEEENQDRHFDLTFYARDSCFEIFANAVVKHDEIDYDLLNACLECYRNEEYGGDYYCHFVYANIGYSDIKFEIEKRDY